jgi:cytosine/uracil/thiamine/allantoin permease|tara:strand:+ start:125 stop:301 length:177 start_codon:yes stop_codon:yes gene_type:complete
MFENGIEVYLGSNEFVGLDKLFAIQRKFDGKIASTIGLTGLSVISFVLGFIVCYLIMS